VPSNGDLLFFSQRPSFAEALGGIVFTAEETKAQSLELWTLHHRSFYAYTLNRSAFCAFFPAGRLELLKAADLSRLAATQVKIKNPALLRAKLPSSLLRGWITSASFHALRPGEKIKALGAWLKENELSGIYPAVKLSSLPKSVRGRLEETGLAALANSFHHRSGPNCLGLAAFAVSEGQTSFLNLWLHGEPFLRLIKQRGFRIVRGTPQAGDLLVVKKKGAVVHAAYYLGEGWLFEKPGQDCYEPYRLVRMQDWNWGPYKTVRFLNTRAH
jgi:hypothetical protein